jgi:hypothetical protein
MRQSPMNYSAQWSKRSRPRRTRAKSMKPRRTHWGSQTISSAGYQQYPWAFPRLTALVLFLVCSIPRQMHQLRARRKIRFRCRCYLRCRCRSY